jgi:Flp pilus assembly protein TadD
MHRLLVRLGALALSSAALAACASDPVNSSTAQAPSNNGATASTLPGSLEGDIREAQLLRIKGDYTGAVRMLSQLMLVTQDDPRIIGEYGKVLVQQGRAPEALNFLKRSVELQPNDWTLYSALGVAYDQTRESAKARDAYQRALVLKPGEAVVLNNFALSRMLAGDPAQAKTLMAEASATGSTNPKIARNRTLIDGLAGSKTIPSAQANADTQTQAPTEPSAVRPPKALTAANTLAAASDGGTNQPGVVMQQVPRDPLAGPVSKKPVKVARTPRKLAKTQKVHRTTAEAVRSTIPALRLANDRP